MQRVIISLCLIVILFSCKKDSSQSSQSNFQLIFGRWNFVSFTDRSGTTVNNSNPCLADNFIVFRTDTTGYTSQGLCLANPSDPRDVEFGKWFFTSVDIMDIGGDEVKILRLTASELWFRETTGDYEYHWKR